MKLITFEEMVRLPPGTLFQESAPDKLGELCLWSDGDLHTMGYAYRPLAAERTIKGEQRAHWPARWTATGLGHVTDDLLFLVWEARDVEYLRAFLKMPEVLSQFDDSLIRTT